MNVKLRTYFVTYKSGKTQTVKGHITLFSNLTNTSIPKADNIVLLNADEVLSVEEKTEIVDKQEEGIN